VSSAAIIQARLGSSRLPGKVLLPLEGKPVIQWVAERVARSSLLDDTIVAVPDTAEDRALALALEEEGVRVFRGANLDVRSRYIDAAREIGADTVVRVTGDCPLVDPGLVDRALAAFGAGGADCVSLGTPGGFPRGFDAEVFSLAALERVKRIHPDEIAAEHVTLGFYRSGSDFAVEQVSAPPPLHAPDLRVCLDEYSDYELLSALCARLGDGLERATAEEVIRLLRDDPELAAINSDVVQRTPT